MKEYLLLLHNNVVHFKSKNLCSSFLCWTCVLINFLFTYLFWNLKLYICLDNCAFPAHPQLNDLLATYQELS